MSANEILKSVFGYSDFREGQKEVIDSLIKGNSTLAIFPTSAGKSMCYQVPALMMDGITIVVSPLMALMKDQVDFLVSKSVPAAKIDSSLTSDEYKQVITKIRSNSLKILFVSPERFNNEIFRNLLNDIHISMFVIDEAHCISEWGHNFRPDYLKLSNYAKKFKAQRVLCLTATANSAVERDIESKFDIKEEASFRRVAYRDNLDLEVLKVSDFEKKGKVLELVENDPCPTIIYVTLQRTAEDVTEYLNECGVKAKFYHAGLDSEERENIQNEFMSSPDSIIVATIAFGMGIDKSDIRKVIHYNLPKSIENYYQEIGRAGRDGEKSKCILFLSESDIPQLETFAIGDFPESDLVKNLLSELFTQDEDFTLKLLSFSNAHDIKQIVVKTILTQLELKGHIEEKTPIYGSVKFKYLKHKEEIISMFPPEKRAFLIELLSHAEEKKIWCHLDLEDTLRAMNIDRTKVLTVLDFLDSKSLIEMKLSNLVNRFSFLDREKTLSMKEELIEEICKTTQDHLEKQIQRISELLSFFTKDECIHNSISTYFATPLDKECGHCSYCLTKSSLTLGDYSNQEITLDLNSVKSELSSHPHIINSPSRLAKYLIGIRSPYISKNKLTKSESFSSLEGRPWREVISFVEGRS